MSSDQPDIYARTLAELARDPAFASFATPDAALLIWDAGATRLLAASPRAERLRRGFADAAGHLDRAFPARGRLQTLGAGLAPLAGLRLERLRLDGLSPPVTCACRRVMLDREPVLVTALLGPVPKGQLPPSRSTQENTQPAFSSPVPAAAGADPALVEPPAPAAPQEQDSAPSRRAWSPPSLDSLRCRGTVRIVWQADAEARFTSIAPALAAIVGPEAGDVVGRSWAELARSAVEDPGGAVADLLARRQTWSGRTVYWSVDGAPWRIPVDWAGLPVFGPDRTLRGFRGFGLLRAEAAEEREAGSAPANAARARVTAPAPAGDPMPEAAPDLNEGGPTSPILPAEPEGHHPPPAGAHEEPEAWSADARQRVAPSHGGAPAPEPAAAAGRVSHGLIGRAERERSSRSAETLSRLSVSERSAFREIARALGARFPFEPQEPDAAEPGKTASDASGAAAEEPAGDGPASGAIPTTVVSAAASESPSTATGEAEPASPGLRAPGPPGEPERSEAAPPDEEAETRFAAELVPEPDLADVETDAAAHPVDDASEFRRPQPPGEVQGDAAPAVTSEPVPPRPLYSPAPVHVLAVPARPAAGDRILDQMPVAALVHRDERVLFANRTFLDLVGCASLADFEEGGGLTSLFGGSPPLRGTETGAEPMALASPGGPLHAEVSVAPMEWGAAPATLILLRPERDAGTRERLAEAESARAEAERGLEEARARIREVEAARDEALERIPKLQGGLAEALTRVRELETGLAEAHARVRELEAVLDTATDGVAVIDGSGRMSCR